MNDSNSLLNDLLFNRIIARYKKDDTWADKEHLIEFAARYQVIHLKMVYNMIMGEAEYSTLTFHDVFDTKMRFPDEIDIIMNFKKMERQGYSIFQLQQYLLTQEKK
jgi:hypothetical protein